VSLRRGLLVAVAAALALGAALVLFLRRDQPERHADAVEHFKYGSIGAEARAGIPLLVWKALPVVFADLLPPPARGPGLGAPRLRVRTRS